MAMNEDNFDVITEKDKSTLLYGACVLGWTATGAAVLRSTGVVGLLLGGVGGAAWGLLTCKYIEKGLKQKISSPTAMLSDDELLSALQAMHTMQPLITKNEAMELFAQVRNEVTCNPQAYQAAMND
jgi:hypothetical protein